MKSFSLKPSGTGSTSKSHKSQSLSISSATSTSASTSSSNAASVVSSSLAHAKLATNAAWSACKNSTISTLKKGSSAFKSGPSDRKSRALSASPASLDWNQGQPRTYSPPRRVRRLFGLGGGTPLSARMSMARYRSLGNEFDSDDDRDIFSGRPFSERVDVHPQKDFDFWQDDNTRGKNRGHTHQIEREIIPVPYTYRYTPQHAASSYLATSTARHMQFSADNGEGDDDEWWRD